VTFTRGKTVADDTDDLATDGTADSMRERADESRLKLWLFYEADRRFVAVVIGLALYCPLLAVGALAPNVTAVLRSGDPVGTTFQALVGAIVTGVTLVVTLNQLVLSQEFGTLDDEYDRYEQTMDIRERIGDHIEPDVTPADPSAFLAAIVAAAAADARALAATVDDRGAAGEAVAGLVTDVRSNAATVTEQLDGAEFGTFDVLSAALDFNYSQKVFEARWVRTNYGDALSAESRDRFDELIETLELYAPAREHIKVLYMQWELVDLSRYVIASAIPALVVSVSTLLFYKVGTPGGAVLGVPVAVVLVCAAITVALSPFLILLSYILRIASVTKWTLAIGPFTLRDTDD